MKANNLTFSINNILNEDKFVKYTAQQIYDELEYEDFFDYLKELCEKVVKATNIKQLKGMEIEDFECSPRYPLVVAFTAPLYKQFGFSLYVVYHDSDFEGVTGSFDVFCTAESRDGKTIKNVDQKKISISSKTKNLFQVLQKVIKQAVDFASK